VEDQADALEAQGVRAAEYRLGVVRVVDVLEHDGALLARARHLDQPLAPPLGVHRLSVQHRAGARAVRDWALQTSRAKRHLRGGRESGWSSRQAQQPGGQDQPTWRRSHVGGIALVLICWR
jgi:hypothetical protein